MSKEVLKAVAEANKDILNTLMDGFKQNKHVRVAVNKDGELYAELVDIKAAIGGGDE